MDVRFDHRSTNRGSPAGELIREDRGSRRTGQRHETIQNVPSRSARSIRRIYTTPRRSSRGCASRSHRRESRVPTGAVPTTARPPDGRGRWPTECAPALPRDSASARTPRRAARWTCPARSPDAPGNRPSATGCAARRGPRRPRAVRTVEKLSHSTCNAVDAADHEGLPPAAAEGLPPCVRRTRPCLRASHRHRDRRRSANRERGQRGRVRQAVAPHREAFAPPAPAHPCPSSTVSWRSPNGTHFRKVTRRVSQGVRLF